MCIFSVLIYNSHTCSSIFSSSWFLYRYAKQIVFLEFAWLWGSLGAPGSCEIMGLNIMGILWQSHWLLRDLAVNQYPQWNSNSLLNIAFVCTTQRVSGVHTSYSDARALTTWFDWFVHLNAVEHVSFWAVVTKLLSLLCFITLTLHAIEKAILIYLFWQPCR